MASAPRNNALDTEQAAGPDSDSNGGNRSHNISGDRWCHSNITDTSGPFSDTEDVLLPPEGHPAKAWRLNILGNSSFSRFEHLGDVADLEKAISAHKGAVELLMEGHPKKPVYLTNLGTSFLTRFEHLGDATDIHKAISAYESAAQLTPDGHSKKPGCLYLIGNALVNRFEQFGDPADLDMAISAQEDAVQMTPEIHPDQPTQLSGLGNSLQRRFWSRGEVADLDNAILMQERALHLTQDDHPERPGCLNNLGLSYQACFNHFGDLKYIDKAIIAYEKAIQLLSDSHPVKHTCLTNLGVSLQIRFKQFGDLADLDKAISFQSKGVQLLPQGHISEADYLNKLAVSFQSRFRQLGDISDLDKAISAKEKAVKLTSESHIHMPIWLNNLGASFLARFQRLGNTSDIDLAITTQEKVVYLTPDGHLGKPSYLSNLGVFYKRRFQCQGDISDINKAISVQESAVHLTPEGSPNLPTQLTNLGNSFSKYFELCGKVTDIDKAISAQERAIQLTPDGHPDKPHQLKNLGISWHRQFEHLKDASALDKAILHSAKGALSSTGPALDRFKTAYQWAYFASKKSLSTSLEAYHCAIEIIPQVAWLGKPMVEQHRELANIGKIVCEATATAITCGRHDTALEWLEQGRSIVWGQLLSLRTPVDEIKEKNPTLADHLRKISLQLEKVRIQHSLVKSSDQQHSMEKISQYHHTLALEWEKLVNTARNIPGFENFLQPNRLSKLKSAAQAGPVVIINTHRTRCDALILRRNMDNVIHIPLEQTSYGELQELQQSLGKNISDADIRTRYLRHMIQGGSQTSVHKTLQVILEELWLKVVKPISNSLGFTVSSTSSPPRIWWCLTGPLAFLPIHAAGLYDTDEPGHKIMDFVTSSYTPTLTALLGTRPEAIKDNFKLLTIIQSSTPGASSLPGANEELVQIQQYACGLSIKSLENAMAIKDQVITSMKDCQWIHLACHGIQKTSDPTSSALLLQDGQLKLSEIIQLNLPHAESAFLSACQTATGDQSLSEESVHLAAGMLLAGYRGVIATMWSIKDSDAPIVAGDVYAELFKDQQPNSTQAAHALHHAVQHLQKRGASFLSWVPFVHIGM